MPTRHAADCAAAAVDRLLPRLLEEREARRVDERVPALVVAAMEGQRIRAAELDLAGVNGGNCQRSGAVIQVAGTCRLLVEARGLPALAFKVATDPYVGRLTFFRVYSGALKKGTYVYYCPVPGHKELGMVGKLIAQ